MRQLEREIARGNVNATAHKFSCKHLCGNKSRTPLSLKKCIRRAENAGESEGKFVTTLHLLVPYMVLKLTRFLKKVQFVVAKKNKDSENPCNK